MKNAKKFDVKMLALWLIAVVLFVVVVFLIPVKRNPVFFVAFAMTLVSFGLVAFAYVQSILRGATLESKLFGYPVFRVSLIALAVQAAVFVVLWLLSAVCPIWAALLAEAVILAGSAAGLIAVEAAQGAVEDAEKVLSADTQTIRALRSKAAVLLSAQTDEPARRAMEKLADALRYCDPVSSEATAPLENQILAQLEAIAAAEEGDRVQLIEKTAALVAQRSAVAKDSKRAR